MLYAITGHNSRYYVKLAKELLTVDKPKLSLIETGHKQERRER